MVQAGVTPAAHGPRHGLSIAAISGALWGLVGYALLWGHTPLVIHPTFVESSLGTLLLLPVRVVLWAIHWLERAAGGPFDFSENNWWIGLAAAAIGAAIAVGIVWAASWTRRVLRRSGREELAESRERI